MPTHPQSTDAALAHHGARVVGDDQVTYCVWAPLAEGVEVAIEGEPVPMTPTGRGWWSHTGPGQDGTRYSYRLDGGEPLPDPAARALPDGVHGPAAVVDPATWAWTDQRFQPVPIEAAVIYELHVGTFTDAGTFEAATAHLDGLVELGVTHVEVMPVNAFDGRFGWGYDGVAWWAVHQPYGGPAAFAAFVDACHAAGLAVILDVVHNHLGPSGNYLSRFGPYLQSTAESTWGKVINLDGPDSDPVRQFLTGNIEMWLTDYHVDALRLDAVHALDDRGSATHILAEFSDVARAVSTRTGRRKQLIAETDRNDPATITPRSQGGLGMDAQWADDLHHAVHVAVTGETDGYYTDYAEALPAVARAFTNGLVYDGMWWSPFRRRTIGAPLPSDCSSRQLVACIQNHDQVGNRPAGDRLTTIVPADLVRVAIALLCVAPQTPMLFMGEEYGETNPFQFFSDMPGEELRDAIRTGRRREFEYFTSWSGEVPDPLDPATFGRSKLNRSAADTEEGRARRALWTDLLALRRSVPALGTGDRRLTEVAHLEDQEVLSIIRRGPAPPDEAIVITANLSDEPITVSTEGTVLLSTADPAYGGTGSPDGQVPARSVVIRSRP
ncbi:malto-oligosyltrehalose trehalohydrolase [Euzebya tangerina]|uniref:malto-oligosyltrehalose trehalohydrolase n=1 Tax=Euzebya tangerina TaxID=591198 RepID=UPI000E30D130|nr:malto-oligosyltrehalose trehalohydrolase [Euzebya tangerina]